MAIRDRISRRVIALTVVIVLILAAGAGVFLFLRWRTERNRTRDYKAALTQGWQSTGEMAGEMLVVMTRIETVQDLDKLAASAIAMRDEIGRFARKMSEMPAPGSMKEVDTAGNTALQSLDLYLQTVSKLASGKDQTQVESEMGVLDSRAIKASEDVGDFFTKAPFVRVTIPGDFYEAGEVLKGVFASQSNAANEQDRIDASDAVRRFMTADLVEKNFGVITSMLSSNRQLFMKALNMTPEQLPGIWAEAWGKDVPVEFYVSKSGTNLTDAEHGTVKVVVYYASKKNPPRTSEIRVVKENGEWKIDSYPFVGWL